MFQCISGHKLHRKLLATPERLCVFELNPCAQFCSVNSQQVWQLMFTCHTLHVYFSCGRKMNVNKNLYIAGADGDEYLKAGLVILSRYTFCYIAWNGLYMQTAINKSHALKKGLRKILHQTPTNYCLEVRMKGTKQIFTCTLSTLKLHLPTLKAPHHRRRFFKSIGEWQEKKENRDAAIGKTLNKARDKPE